MQIEIAPSAALQFAASNPEHPLDYLNLPEGFIDLPEIPATSDEVYLPSGYHWTVIRRFWYPGTNKPPSLILGFPDEGFPPELRRQ
jgi:hypothetical protein